MEWKHSQKTLWIIKIKWKDSENVEKIATAVDIPGTFNFTQINEIYDKQTWDFLPLQK